MSFYTDPATPVTTTSTTSGNLGVTFFRLCVRAPRTFITPDGVAQTTSGTPSRRNVNQ